jgi:hypothetical protein
MFKFTASSLESAGGDNFAERPRESNLGGNAAAQLFPGEFFRASLAEEA